MPTLESLCTSLDLSRQLEEAGCPQESTYVWYRLKFLPEYLSDDPWAWHVGQLPVDGPDQKEPSSRFELHYSAYTAEELLRLLPKRLNPSGLDAKPLNVYWADLDGGNWDVGYFQTNALDPSLANACSKLYLSLKEKGLV